MSCLPSVLTERHVYLLKYLKEILTTVEMDSLIVRHMVNIIPMNKEMCVFTYCDMTLDECIASVTV